MKRIRWKTQTPSHEGISLLLLPAAAVAAEDLNSCVGVTSMLLCLSLSRMAASSRRRSQLNESYDVLPTGFYSREEIACLAPMKEEEFE